MGSNLKEVNDLDPVIRTNQRIGTIAPSATLSITAKAKALKQAGKPVISLAAGEPDFGVPDAVREAIHKALDQQQTKYTPTSGTPELKQAVIDKLKRDQALTAAPDSVVISLGAKHALYNLFQVLLEPGDEVIIPSPYWVSYPEMIKLAGGKAVFVDTISNKFLMTRELIEPKITSKTRVIVLNSPSNPTGAVLSEIQIKAIANLLQERKLYCLSDEIYEYYVYDGMKHHSVASYIPNWQSHVAIVNGLSKSHSMTGLRIGYTIAHPDIAKKMGILQDHSTSNPVSICQVGAIEALKMPSQFTNNLSVTFQKRRDLVVDLLRQIPQIEITAVPQGAFYIFVNIRKSGMKAHEFASKLLEENFVAIIPGEGFGTDEYVRISFAASDKELTEGIQRMQNWLKSK